MRFLELESDFILRYLIRLWLHCYYVILIFYIFTIFFFVYDSFFEIIFEFWIMRSWQNKNLRKKLAWNQSRCTYKEEFIADQFITMLINIYFQFSHINFFPNNEPTMLYCLALKKRKRKRINIYKKTNNGRSERFYY